LHGILNWLTDKFCFFLTLVDLNLKVFLLFQLFMSVVVVLDLFKEDGVFRVENTSQLHKLLEKRNNIFLQYCLRSPSSI